MSMQKNGNKRTSSTFSSSMQMSQGQPLTTDNKKKRGESSNSGVGIEAGPSQSQESSVKETTMNNLPPEMLTKILKYVDTLSLFKCRLVNRNWNAIASGILRNRSNAKIRFEYTVKYGFSWRTFRPFSQEPRSLGDFVTCIKNSKDSPFSQFSFNNKESRDPLKFFTEKDFEEFISYFASSNQRIKSLSLNFCSLDNVKKFQLFTQKLSDLLLNKIPRLEELVLDFEVSVEAPEVKLFTIPKQTTTSPQFQLPHLKVLGSQTGLMSSYTEMFRDLLNAAINLKNISMAVCKLTDFQLLQSLGKLHLLEKSTIELDQDFFSATESDKNIGLLPLPKLEILTLGLNMYDPSPSFRSKAAKFLRNLFESSKDTVTELKSQPVGFFPSLQLPTFKKLWKLDLTQYSGSSQPVFPPGIRSRVVFPAVSHLDLNIGEWDDAFPQEDSIPVLPRVKTLRIEDFERQASAISILAAMCPNLQKLQIFKYDFLELDFLLIGRAIWTEMKQLESLEVDVNVDSLESSSFALDSCFTGISLENCERLCKVMEAKEMLENIGASVDIPESKLEAVANREYSSILDMKDLKTLIIHPYSENKLLKRMDFFTKLTWISEEFAFKFLPHLKPKPEEED